MSASRRLGRRLYSCTGCLELRPLYFGVVVVPPKLPCALPVSLDVSLCALCPSCAAICVAICVCVVVCRYAYPCVRRYVSLCVVMRRYVRVS
eukprot:4370399-Pyramimonas_sp.AAC.1